MADERAHETAPMADERIPETASKGHDPDPTRLSEEQLRELVGLLTERLRSATQTPAANTAATETPADSLPSVADEKRPKARLPNPDKYNGRRSRWLTWKAQMVTKLQIDGKAIGNKRDQFAFIYACLDGTPAATVVTFYTTMMLQNPDPDDFIKYMESIYGDPNRAKRALVELQGLSQGSTSFTAFLPKFEKLLVEAGGMEWSDDVKMSYLEKTLTGKLKDALVYHPNTPETYTGFKEYLLTVSSKLNARKLEREVEREKSVSSDPDEMDWEPTRTNRQKVGRSRRSGPTQGKAGWVSDREYQRRREEGLCLRCGSDSHFVAGCKQRQARRPSQDDEKKSQAKKATTASGSRKSKAPTRSLVDSRGNSATESTDSDESGKE